MSRMSSSSPATMLNLIAGFQVSQLVFIAAELGIADVLAKGAKSTQVIANKVGVHEPSLYRVLRVLASVGVFAEGADKKFRLTPLAQTLRSDRKDSLRDYARMMIGDYSWRPWGELMQGVRTGERVFDSVYKMPLFEYLQRNPDKERVYSASMASLSTMQNTAISRSYPFGHYEKLVDVGGAHGHLLGTILRRHSKLQGVLFDQPSVVAQAAKKEFVTTPTLRKRCTIIGGSFFDAVPPDADAYLLKHIIHDWNDTDCVRILRNCRDAMRKGGRVLVADDIIAPGNKPDFGKFIDIHMMLIGGRERTREEFLDLFSAARLKLKRVIPTGTLASILETVAA